MLWRVTVALPVRVATLPIGSSESAGAAACAGEAGAAGAGRAWANFVSPESFVAAIGACSVCVSEAIAAAS